MVPRSMQERNGGRVISSSDILGGEIPDLPYGPGASLMGFLIANSSPGAQVRRKILRAGDQASTL